MFRKYFETLRSPDDPAAPEPEAVATPEVAAPDAPEVAETPTPGPPKPDVPAWVWDRIGEETNKRQATEQQLEEHAKRIQNYEEIIRRLQTETPPANTPAPKTPEAPTDVIEQRAQQLVMQRELASINDAGMKSYGARWEEAVKALTACGANTLDFIRNVSDVDGARSHDILFQIAQNPQQAVSLAKMSPGRRIAEITGLVMAEKAKSEPKEPKPEEPQRSRAPAPKPVLVPNPPAPEVDPTTPDGNDKMSDADFEKWYKSKYYKRA